MKYRKRTRLQDIQKKYRNILLWGGGRLLIDNVSSRMFNAAAVVDGRGDHVGETGIGGLPVIGTGELGQMDGRILVVCYTIYEAQVLHQMAAPPNADPLDFIDYTLLETQEADNMMPHSFAKNGEDLLAWLHLSRLRPQGVNYLEIGVCHPMMRNNTFLLHELCKDVPGYRGVLVEANPLCWDLIEEYRPEDKLVRKGISASGGTLTFHQFPDLLGHSTFDAAQAEKDCMETGFPYRTMDIETVTINDVLATAFNRVPDLLSLDAEGLDEEILNSMDFERYPIPVLITEMMEKTENGIHARLGALGYRVVATTEENAIWIKK